MDKLLKIVEEQEQVEDPVPSEDPAQPEDNDDEQDDLDQENLELNLQMMKCQRKRKTNLNRTLMQGLR